MAARADRTETLRFKAVEWLPAFALDPESVRDEFDIVVPPGRLGPFYRFEWPLGGPRVRCVTPPQTGLAIFSDRELRQGFREIDPADQKEAAQTGRASFHAQLLENRLNRRLKAIGGWDQLLGEIERERARFLRQIDQNEIPGARAIQRVAFQIPRVFCHLGRCMPTKEMIGALRSLQPILELGAGFGLVARALERARIDVAAVDKDEQESGIAFPVVIRDASEIHMTIDGKPATPLVLWPHLDDDWFLHAFRSAKPGRVVAMASPEFDHLLRSPRFDRKIAQKEWPAGVKLQALLANKFEQTKEVPTASAEPGSELIPLRFWRRK